MRAVDAFWRNAVRRPRRSRDTTTAGVFLDPSGRRWRRVSIFSAVVLVPLLAITLFGAVQAREPLTLPDGEKPPPVPVVKQGGDDLPVVGTGPLVRVLETRRGGGRVTAVEPFTGQEIALTPAEARATQGGRYVVQRYGYSATARRTISLTFDDGPDPVLTRRLLDVLAREKVPATFFVTGANAATHPDVVRRQIREGHAVANHTLTHADLKKVQGWRANDELVLTDRVLRAVTDQATKSFRLPYGGAGAEDIQDNVAGILRAQRLRYVVTSYDFDTFDWKYSADPGEGRIPLPEFDGSNITVLMHDAGGQNRQQTIEYVEERLIPAARAAGYRFQTMPQVAPDLRESTVPAEPSVLDRATLLAVEVFTVWPSRLVTALFWFAVVSVVVLGLGSILLAVARRRSRRRMRPEGPVLPVTVLIAAYNEEEVIRRTLRTVAASRYPILEIVVVDDGSTDGTSAEVLAAVDDDDRIRLIQQPNGGKWSALNNGLRWARGEIVVTLDADTVFTEDTVGHLVRQFAQPGGARLGAVAGVVRVGNRTENLLTRWQALEYLTQIGVERAAFAQLGAIPIIPGACAAWRRQAVQDAGGYAPATLAEDCDLTLSLHRAGWGVAQDDDAVAYTEAPDHVDALLAQRIRWTFGTLQALWKHRDMMFRPRYGALGMLVLPFMALSTAVPILFLPLVALVAVVAVQQQGWWVVGFYFGAFTLVHAIVASAACVLMREKWQHLVMVPVYRVVYEPLRAYLLYTSAYLALRGVRTGWNKLQRTGAIDAAILADDPDVPVANPERAEVAS